MIHLLVKVYREDIGNNAWDKLTLLSFYAIYYIIHFRGID